MGDHQGRLGAVNLGPFDGVDLICDWLSIYPLPCWQGHKMNQTKSLSFHWNLDANCELSMMSKGKTCLLYGPQRTTSVQIYSFVLLQFYQGNGGDLVGATAMVPLIDENLLKFDTMGYSFDNGPFMQMDRLSNFFSVTFEVVIFNKIMWILFRYLDDVELQLNYIFIICI